MCRCFPQSGGHLRAYTLPGGLVPTAAAVNRTLLAELALGGGPQGPYERLKRTVRERKSTMEEVTAAVHSLEPTACDKVEPLQALDGLLNKLHSLKRKVRPCAVFPPPSHFPISRPAMHVCERTRHPSAV